MLIGPVGWIGLGLLAFFSLTGRNHTRLTHGVLMVHCIRARLALEEENLHAERKRARRLPEWCIPALLVLMLCLVALGSFWIWK